MVFCGGGEGCDSFAAANEHSCSKRMNECSYSPAFCMDKAMSLAAAVTAIAVTTVVFWALKRCRRLRLFKDLGIPGPKPDFIWGNLKQMDHRRIEAFVQWRKEYGKLFGVYVGSEPFFVISEAQMAYECLVKQAAIFQDRPAAFVDAEPFKSSLLQLGGNAWKYVRARLNYGFSSGTIKELSEKANVCANKFVERISSISLRNGYVEVFDRGLDFTFDFIMNVVLAQQVRSQEDCNEPILESLKHVVKDMQNSAIEVAFTVPAVRAFLTLIYPLTKHAREFRNVVSHVQKTVELHRSGKLSKEVSIIQKLLDVQSEDLNTAQENRSRLDKHLNDHFTSSNVTIFLLAGIETTASLLSFLLHILARHPEEQHKLVKEIEDVLASEGNSELHFDKFHLLKRVDMVIYEGLRLYPSVPLYVVRRCSVNTNVCGQFIPAGVNVMVAPWLIHHDPDYWPDPDEFRPDRFVEESSESRRKGVYVPFGLGPRVCIGQKLAFLAVKCALVKVLQKFQLTIRIEDSLPPTLSVPSMTLVPGDGVKVSLEHRKEVNLNTAI
ncbi:hypothetical protein MTO96_010503 [Rhipicephalus appendiculatus]